MVVKLPVQQVKYFAGARLLALTQWGSCKPIIVIFSLHLHSVIQACMVIVSLRLIFNYSFRGDKLGIQCSIALIKASI